MKINEFDKMKKLYAKTSFATKKSPKQTKLSAVELDNHTNDENKHKYPSPIMAYDNGEAENSYGFMGGGYVDCGETATINKTPKMARAVRKDAELSLPPRSHSPQISLSSLPANLLYNPAHADESKSAKTNYYYSITEVEHLPMLDQRHINWQQAQRARQQEWRRRRLTQTPVLTAPLTPFHQHQKMMLQLPLANNNHNNSNNHVAVNGKENSIETFDMKKNTKIASPIYEQPQIVTKNTNNNSTTKTLNHKYNEDDIGNNFISLPRDFSVASSSGSLKGGGASEMMAGVGSLNSSRRLFNSQQNDGHNNNSNNNINNNNNHSNNNNNEYDDKCSTTAKTSLHHSQSLPSVRLNGNTSTPTMSAKHSLNFYHQQQQEQKLDYQQKQHEEQIRKLTLQQEPQQSLQHYNSLPLERHNSVKENFINGGFAAFNIEQSIIGARASVMVYDDNQKKWIPSGTSSGLSKVQIYHHQQNNTFRVVGRKLQDHEVVINCSILKGLKYNQATTTFHQWRDSKLVYGLNFSSQHDAEAFARAMTHALDILSGRVGNNLGQPTNGNGGYEEDMGYRTMTSEDAAILRQQQITGQVTPSAQTPTSQQTNQNLNNIPQSPPTPQGHHRTSRNSLSAPPAPQPQVMSMAQAQPTAQQQQLYAQAGITNGQPSIQNGIQHNQQQQQQQQMQPQAVVQQQQQQAPPPMPMQQLAQNQYHAPQQLQSVHQQQMQQTQLQQQQQSQAAHNIYATQQMMNAVSGGYQTTNQYQPHQNSHYVISNSNPNLNLQQYSQQQQQQQLQQNVASQPPMPPPHQNGGPIYVSSVAATAAAAPPSLNQPSHGLTSSTSSNSVVYASQQQLSSGGISQGQPPPQSNVMSNGIGGAGAPPPPPPHAYGQLNGGGGMQESPYGQVPKPPSTTILTASNGQNGVPLPPPLNRMSSQSIGGPAPPPLPSFGYQNGAPPPPAPPAPPSMGGPSAPPPPPPPPMGGGNLGSRDAQADLMGSLAAQLQQAKLKKKSTSVTPAVDTNGQGGNYGTIGRSTCGMASMMDEMAKTLARRRAQAERKEPEPELDAKQRPWEKSNTLPHKLNSSNSSTNTSNSNSNNTSNSGGESPRPIRKRFGSASEETILKVNGDGLSLALSGSDLDALKAEIVKEMRLEIQKVKQEIIDAIKSEFNRR